MQAGSQGETIDMDTGEILSAPVVRREQCTSCKGTTKNRLGQPCASCGGRGFREFTTSPEQRAATIPSRPSPERAREERLKREREQRLQAFDQRHPGTAEWLKAATLRGFDFAAEMLAKVRRGDALTTNMVLAIERCMAKDKERAEQRAADDFRAQELARPVHSVNLNAVEEAFSRAKAQGIQWPKLVLDGFKLAPAGANSRNAGAIYVTKGADPNGLYLGRVMRGEFLPARECDEPTRDRVLEALADPLASAIAYGKRFGRCAVCHRELSDQDSVDRGIGPICFDRMFGGT